MTAKQERVIGLLLAGKSVVEAAKLTKIGRSTIQRWKREDADFIAALNTARSERQRAHICELEAMVSAAIANVRGAIEGGDLKTSLMLLNKIGLLDGGEPLGPTNAEDIRDELERAELLRAERQKSVELAQMFVW